MGKVQVRNAALLLLVSSATLFSAGCSALEDTANSAASQLSDAASKEIVRQACAPIQDGRIDASELRVLSSLVGAVEGGGLPQDLVDVLGDLADSGDSVSAGLQDRLVQACDDATAEGS